MIIYYNEPIERDGFTKLVKSFNEITKDDKEVELYFSSTGGLVSLIPAYVNLMNKYATKIYYIDQVNSSGFIISMLTNVDSEFLDGCSAVCHKPSVSNIALDVDLKPISMNSTELRTLKHPNPTYDNVISGIEFTKEERKLYDNGEDVIFDSDRLTEIKHRLTEIKKNMI
ncbi:MAG: hypothetical protein M0P15_04395 [Bacteroides sp.]|nr:hypothetical protein [Bacteroides sp.]